jgi:hypothetical protein
VLGLSVLGHSPQFERDAIGCYPGGQKLLLSQLINALADLMLVQQ